MMVVVSTAGGPSQAPHELTLKHINNNNSHIKKRHFLRFCAILQFLNAPTCGVMVEKEDNTGVFVSTTFEKPEQVRETFSQGV